ncbi:acetyltransferase [Photobacterium phosphoreum]|uniref:acetyltransferase n=1 Tax=Photobacterium phosphoreum TaxID=659 RepID=UPI0039AFFE9F
MKTLAILGASGHGKVIADIAEQVGWDNIVFFDDKWPLIKKVLKWPIIGDTNSQLIEQYENFFVAIGNNSIRKEKTLMLLHENKKLPNLIHPSAIISKYTNIGKGIVITENAIVKISSSIGDGVVINSNSVIGHDCIIGDFSHITPSCSIAGHVSIGECSWIGNGSSVRQCISIGENVMIGSGAVVVKNIPSNMTVIGNPARPI